MIQGFFCNRLEILRFPPGHNDLDPLLPDELIGLPDYRIILLGQRLLEGQVLFAVRKQQSIIFCDQSRVIQVQATSSL